jgi:hypothetical protein
MTSKGKNPSMETNVIANHLDPKPRVHILAPSGVVHISAIFSGVADSGFKVLEFARCWCHLLNLGLAPPKL